MLGEASHHHHDPVPGSIKLDELGRSCAKTVVGVGIGPVPRANEIAAVVPELATELACPAVFFFVLTLFKESDDLGEEEVFSIIPKTCSKSFP